MTMQNPEHMVIDDQTIFFGDSRRMKFIEDETIDFIMTSPPYWNLKNYGHDEQIGNSDYNTYLQQLSEVWDELYRVAKPNAVFILNIGNRRHNKQYLPIGMDIYARMKQWKLWDTIIWYIPNALPQPASYIERLFDNKFEFLFLFTKDGGHTDYTFHKPRVPNKYREVDPRKYKMNKRGRCLGNIIRIPAYRPPNVKSMNYHVASYPEELVALMMHTMTDEEDVVLDPFLGSGTTLKVAKAMKRKGIGIEINSNFKDTIYGKVNESFSSCKWENIDIIHSTTMKTGTKEPRKIHQLRSNGV